MLVFYSESPIYYQYYEDVIEYILDTSSLVMCYFTSCIDDPVFKKESERFKVFYIENLVAPFIRELDAKVLVMTMPDIGQFHVKKSIYKLNHLYVFHAIISTHMSYRKGAFDNYDTVFCVGKHHTEEIRKTEEIYNFPKKTLVPIGYPRLEHIYKDHQKFLGNHNAKRDEKIILIAPSWGENNIIESYTEELIHNLKSLGDEYTIVLRPHPQFLRTNEAHIISLEKKYKDNNNILIETNLVSDINIHMASMLITDWSGIAFEYAFGTERPVLFIDTPRKIFNPEYDKIKIEPLSVKLRDKIGKAISTDAIHTVSEILTTLSNEKEEYRKRIIKYRDAYIYNWGRSAKVSGDYIINLCK